MSIQDMPIRVPVCTWSYSIVRDFVFIRPGLELSDEKSWEIDLETGPWK